MDNLEHFCIENLIKDYAYTRKKFEVYKEKLADYLDGNDNYVGIIGEYWAKRFLENLGREVASLNRKDTDTRDKSSKWTDFIVNNNEHISVKAIFEAESGRSGAIKYDDKPVNKMCSIIIVKLDINLFPSKILYIKDVDENILNGEFIQYADKWKQGSSLEFKYYKNTDNFDNELSKFVYKYEKEKFIKMI